MVNDQWLMINDQWLILQHWRGGLQVLLVTKNCFIILGGGFVMWWERRIASLVGGRIAIRPYMCDTTLVLGICWLHSSLFTTYPSSFAWLHSSLFTLHHIPKLIRLATLFTLHFSLFTLFTIVVVLRGESCGVAGGTLPSP